MTEPDPWAPAHVLAAPVVRLVHDGPPYPRPVVFCYRLPLPVTVEERRRLCQLKIRRLEAAARTRDHPAEGEPA